LAVFEYGESGQTIPTKNHIAVKLSHLALRNPYHNEAHQPLRSAPFKRRGKQDRDTSERLGRPEGTGTIMAECLRRPQGPHEMYLRLADGDGRRSLRLFPSDVFSHTTDDQATGAGPRRAAPA
jgi:hypothetical protein